MSRTNATDEESHTITRELLDIGSENDLTILAARDYGSRARTLESDESDYDVLFLYAQRHPSYIVQTEYQDTIHRTVQPDDTDLDTEIELNGWNLRKFVGGSELKGHADGIIGSDPMALEFIASDTEYYRAPCMDGSLDSIEYHIEQNFKPYALMRHYHSLALQNYKKYIDGDWTIEDYGALLDHVTFHDVNDDYDTLSVSEENTIIEDGLVHVTAEVTNAYHSQVDLEDAIDAEIVRETEIDRTIKRYLNVSQALLKRRYVEDEHDLAPMDFNELLRWSAGRIPEDVYALLGDLAVRKRNTGGTAPPSDEGQELLRSWIDDELDTRIEPEDHVERTPDVEEISKRVRLLIRNIY